MRHVIAVSGCIFAAAGFAFGQDVATVEAVPLGEMLLDGPRDLPGKVVGPREREEPTPPESPEPAEPEPREWVGGLPWWQWSRATGDWGGGRTRLEESGITFDASLTWDWSSVWSGGLNQKASDRLLFDINATIDMNTLADWKGATFYLDAYFADVSGGSRDVGDYQGISNIDTGGDSRSQLAEVWYQQWLFEEVLRLKIGKIDASYEFGFTEAGSDFLHNSPAYSPTLQDLPVYPDPAMGAVLFVYPTELWYVGGGVFDGALHDGINTGNRWPDTFFSDSVSDSWFLIAETGLTWDNEGGPGKGRAAAGVFHHSGEYETFEGGEQNGSSGVYGLVEQQVWRRGTGDDAENGLYLFGQLGLGDDDVNDVGLHAAAGCVLRGVCEGRPDDVTGVYVSYADLSDAPGSPYPNDETAIEFMYMVQITPGVALTPDLQVIVDPSGDPTIDTAVVGAIRLMVSF